MRPISGRDELDLFCRLTYTLDHELADDLDAGRRLPEWMWVALRGDHLVARVAWWGDPDPELLDIFDIESGAVDDGVALLEAAFAAVVPAGGTPPEYLRFVPPDWREQPESRRVVEERLAAIERLGARPLVERLRLEWRPGTPIAEPSGRLLFRQPHGRDEMIELMTRVLDGTLDAHSRDDLTRMTPTEAAAAHFDRELAIYISPRDWWRVATLPDGEPVGFVTPGRNPYNPVIGYVAVLPEHRGKGYVDEILAEGTRVLAAEGVPRVRAATDMGNTPMAAAFARAGYVTFEKSVNWSWDQAR
ncbi:N-acetyltransferase [Phytohabitans aurantiacus]|uniref:N-acetyltransferase n=2 Tax=Phytohabitans aurantiacus TaxID=3016789 RepID=A0ABQ5QQY9_9ACTN|nr:N-acetyltransferase [Phytohabitans aurantiacus]